MIMLSNILESSKIVLSKPHYIIIAALTGIYIYGGSSDVLTYMSLVNAIIGLLVNTFVYGRYVEIIAQRQRESYVEIYKEHLINFICIAFLLSLPVFIFSLLLEDYMTHLNSKITGHMLALIIAATTIYVFPLLFLNGERSGVIREGISFLKNNIIRTLPLMALTIFIYLVEIMVNISAPTLIAMLMRFVNTSIQVGNVAIYAFALGFAQNLFLVFISFIVFNTACMMLLQQRYRLPERSIEGA